MNKESYKIPFSIYGKLADANVAINVLGVWVFLLCLCSFLVHVVF